MIYGVYMIPNGEYSISFCLCWVLWFPYRFPMPALFPGRPELKGLLFVLLLESSYQSW